MTQVAASPDLLRLLAGFVAPPGAEHKPWAQALGLAVPASLEAWQAAHTETFITQCAPYASVYLGAQGAIGGEAADRVADFRRLLGAHIDGPADALSALLSDYAAVVAQAGSDARAAHARQALLWEHLLCWLPFYLDSVARSAAAPYADWAGLTRAVFQAEAGLFEPPAQRPLHLRAAPEAGIQRAGDGLDEIATAVLIPIRSGLILTRHDLIRVAEALGMPAGFGSRRFILRRIIETQPQAGLQQLADAASRQAVAHAAQRDTCGPIADFWSQRATRSAAALAEMARAAPAATAENSAV